MDDRNKRNHLLLSTTYGLNSSTPRRYTWIASNERRPLCTYCQINKKLFRWNLLRLRYMAGVSAVLYGAHEAVFMRESKNQISPDYCQQYFYQLYQCLWFEGCVADVQRKQHRIEYGQCRTEEQAQPPMKKRRKTFNVPMQRAIFLSLENITKCANAHLSQLVSIDDTVNSCIKYVISEIELKLFLHHILIVKL